MRLLLIKQDEISKMEEELDRIDAEEQRELFLSCVRRDGNVERENILHSLKAALSEYDSMMKEYQHALHLPAADRRDVVSMKNWIEGTGCIQRKESRYLDLEDDLLNLTGTVDSAITRIETVIEDCAVWIAHHICKRIVVLPDAMKPGRQSLTQDEHIFVLGPRLQTFSRALTAWLATVILLMPIVVLFCVSSPVVRLITIIFAAGFFLSALSMLTHARTVEIFTAGASYAAVLVVFTSASNAFRPERY
ncbi:uncharacterized protein BKCO1_10400011 [Diplodia corticola]|uniref:DUF6594 domain-containing protein n=1 Tax=Diplodia corticola TaxID=236234 RepID=A0A1J9QKA1_9PEZI|nr:uncharacterized protein BKCO1_10400011 [Diplodia corticola]OJD28905.1 hypothetical protein BKCO1_10400011 [Diplodia corticola]